MRLIDADKIQYSKDWVVTDRIPKVGGYNAKAIYRVTKEEIDAMPTVDAVPVRHGRWIIKDNPGTGWYRVTCSECGEDVTSVAPVIGFFPKAKVIWDFCPDCGAKMDGKDGEGRE